MIRRPILPAVVSVVLLAVADGSLAQRDSSSSESGIGVAIVPGLSVQKARDLIVGEFRPGESSGTVDIDVAQGRLGSARSASGGVALAGAAFSAAEFSVTAPAGGPVHFAVVLPASITITRLGGSETMTVDRFRSNVSADCGPGAPPGGCSESPYTLLVGATLHVASNQTAGQYVGTFTVTVNQL